MNMKIDTAPEIADEFEARVRVKVHEGPERIAETIEQCLNAYQEHTTKFIKGFLDYFKEGSK